ncbi:A24 family peptidase [Cryobacterium sp. TMT2-42-4]|uniref:prepilin peptidase n=1 Tax=Cryobacterium sp. TMT2-42-4 TaxID=1259255 RepID=UPI00106C8D86|nr:A24 family peptidase [Cryobacterium sp. TMT2-42-4]TFC35446.1 prepilin peptidase [Cryobacterium sp. TMT2-42-4]
MVSLLVAGTGLLGSLIGSFLNVVIFRVPAGRSIVSPESACGGCGARIRPWDNVPVFSWLALRGRCRDCKVHISARYPLVELGTAVFFAGVAAWVLSGVSTISITGFGSTTGLAMAAALVTLVAFLYLAGVSISLAMIDLDTHTLPNRIVLPAYPVATVLLGAAAMMTGEPGRILGALVGGAALFGVYLLLALAYPAGMGLGDVKLAGVLGLYLGWLGWGELAVGGFAAFLLGGFFALVLVIARKANRKSGIPFGPWMLAGAWLGIFYGEQIANGYLSLIGLAS